MKWLKLVSVVVVLFAVGCSRSSFHRGHSEYSLDFCKEWNPDFEFNGNRCVRKARSCNPARRLPDLCSEMTPTQIRYSELISSSHRDEVFTLISSDGEQEQAIYSVNDGFLAHGRRIIPTPFNRIALRFPSRCTNFGTNSMASLLEWLGHEVASQYSERKYQGVKIVVGDVSAPKGGCLWGYTQRVAHRSHKNGQDADIGYLWVKSGKSSPVEFHQSFDPQVNWWFLKKIFKNPYVCIKLVLLDQRNIQKLAQVAKNDPDWARYRSYIVHARGHHNHFHVRIGDYPGHPGCFAQPSTLAAGATKTKNTTYSN